MNENENVLEQPEEQPEKEAGVEDALETLVEKQTEKLLSEDIVPEDIALETVEQIKGDRDEVTLKNGYRVKFHSISYNLLYGASVDIIDPEPPMQPHPSDPNRAPVPNPTEPNYLKTIRENELKRSDAIQDNLYLFGIELLDPMPEDDLWLRKLILAKHVNKEDADNADELQKELWYKKYIVADVETLQRLLKMTDISEEGIARASAAFKSNA